jgi:hypothetical protein
MRTSTNRMHLQGNCRGVLDTCIAQQPNKLHLLYALTPLAADAAAAAAAAVADQQAAAVSRCV